MALAPAEKALFRQDNVASLRARISRTTLTRTNGASAPLDRYFFGPDVSATNGFGISRQRARTSPGTMDFVAPGLGECKGAIFWLTRAVADGVLVDQAVLGYGATDGTNDRACSTSSEHNQSGTDTYKRAKTGKCILLLNPADGTIDGEAQFSAFLTDGIRINVTDGFADNYQIHCLLIGDPSGTGDTPAVFVGDFDTASGNVTVTAPGFRPTLVNVFGIRAAIDNTTTSGAAFSNGWCTDDEITTTQLSQNWGEDDAVGTSAPFSRNETANVARDLQNSTVGGAVNLDTFSASGFRAEQIGGAGFPCMYVAIRTPYRRTLKQFATPTTAIVKAFVADLPPVIAFGNINRLRTADANNESALAGVIGFFAFQRAENQRSMTIQVEDGVATTNTSSIADDYAINMPDHQGTMGASPATLAEFYTWDAQGYSLNFLVADATNIRSIHSVNIGPLYVTVTDFTPTAGAADATAAAQVVHQTSIAVSAGAATTAIDVDVIPAGVTVDADIDATAGAATTAVDAEVIHQTTDGSVAAGAADITTDAERFAHAPQFAANFPGGISDGLTAASGNDLSGSDHWEVWIRADTLQDCSIFQRWSNLGTKLYKLSLSSGGTLTWKVGAISPSLSTTIVAGRWYQIVLGYGDGDFISMRVSDVSSRQLGTKQTSTSGVPSIPGGSTGLAVGFDANLVGGGFDGQIQWFRHWDSNLDDTAETALFNGGRGYTTEALRIAQATIHLNLTYSYDLCELSDGSRQVPRYDSIAKLASLTDSALIPSTQGWGTAMMPSPATTSIAGDVIHQTGQLAAIFDNANSEVLKAQDTTWDLNYDNPNNAHTFECWVQPTGVDTIVFGLWGVDPADQQYCLVYDGITFTFNVVDSSSSLTTISSSVSVTAGVWYHVVCTVDADNADIVIHVNTIPKPDVYPDTTFKTVTDATEFYVGGDVSAPRYWDGAITALRHWDRLLSDSEIAQLYNGGCGMTLAQLNAAALSANLLQAVEMLEWSDGTKRVDRRNWQIPTLGHLSDASDTVPSTGGRVGFCADAGPATVDIAAQRIHIVTDGSVSAAVADVTTDLDVIHQTTDFTVSAAIATALLDLDRISDTDLAVQAGAADAALAAQVVHQTTDFTPSAGAATTAIDAEVLGAVSADIDATASAATADVAAQVVHQTTDGSVAAGAATSAISAKHVVQTSVAVQAGAATADLTAQRISQTSVAVQAGAATAALAAEVVHQTTDFTPQAGAATTAISVTLIQVDATIAASASVATADLVSQVVHQTTDGSVAAGQATAAVAAKRIVQTSVACQAGAATADVSGQRAPQCALAVQAGTATTAAPSQVIHQTTDFTPQAGAATTAIDAEIAGVNSTTLAVQASAATADLVSQVVHQTTDGAVQAGAATTAIPTKHVIQTSVAVQAGAATAAIVAQKKVSTTIAVQAGQATADLASQVIHQTAMAVQAGAATADLVAVIAAGRIIAQAGAATADLTAQVIHQSALALLAQPADALLDLDLVHQTNALLQAGAATADLTGQFVYSGTLAAQAGQALAQLLAQRVSRTTLTLSASPADVTLLLQLIHQTELDVLCDPATAALSGGQGIVLSLVLSADAAQIDLVAQVIHQGVIVCDADGGRGRLLGYPVIWYTPAVILRPITEQLVLEIGPGAATIMRPLPDTVVLDLDASGATLFLPITKQLP